VSKNKIDSPENDKINDPQSDGDENYWDQNHLCGRSHLLAARPGYFLEFGKTLFEESDYLLHLIPLKALRVLSFKKEAGQAGLEPATSGFGDRRSSQLELLAFRRSLLLYLGFLMQGVFSVKLAVLHELQLSLDVPLVFCGCIIPAVAFATL
jgi:hypothetical protein